MCKSFFLISIVLLLFCQFAAANEDSYIVNLKKSNINVMGVKSFNNNDENISCFDEDCFIVVNKAELDEMLLNDPHMYYEPNYEIEIPPINFEIIPSGEIADPAAADSAVTTDDFESQWIYNKEFINYKKAKNIAEKVPQVSSNPPVAVIIDTGFSLHKAIYGDNNSHNLMEFIDGDYCSNFSTVNGVVSKNSGCVSYHPHGNLVAGTMTAVINGTNYGTSFGKGKIYSINVSQYNYTSSYKHTLLFSNIIKALEHIYYLKKSGENIVVVNMSLSNTNNTVAEYKVINKLKQLGIITVVATGNSFVGGDIEVNPQFPASYALDNIVSVTSINSNNYVSAFSIAGKYATMAAPGEGIVTTLNLPQNSIMNSIGENDPNKVFHLQNDSDRGNLIFDNSICSYTEDKLVCAVPANTSTIIKTPPTQLSNINDNVFAYVKVPDNEYYQVGIFYGGKELQLLEHIYWVNEGDGDGIVMPIDNHKRVDDSSKETISFFVKIKNTSGTVYNTDINKIVVAKTDNIDTYVKVQGTSFASPFVAGAILAANVIHPNISPEQTINLLYKSATKVNYNKDKKYMVAQDDRVIDIHAFFQEVEKCRDVPSSCSKYTRYPVKPGLLPNGVIIEAGAPEDYDKEDNKGGANHGDLSSSSTSGGCSISCGSLYADKLFIFMLIVLSALFARNSMRKS